MYSQPLTEDRDLRSHGDPRAIVVGGTPSTSPRIAMYHCQRFPQTPMIVRITTGQLAATEDRHLCNDSDVQAIAVGDEPSFVERLTIYEYSNMYNQRRPWTAIPATMILSKPA